ncbi:MAG: sulfatase-like hydrolase/transferase [Bacteroidota bacterium]
MRRLHHWFLFACIALFATGCSITTDEFAHTPAPDALEFHRDFLKATPNQPPTSAPNIVLILADDLGKTDISLYGSPHIQTPNIDRIGREGVTFDEGYCSSPICAPSRAGLLTGRYQQRFGFEFQPHGRYPRNKLEYWVYKKFIARDDWRVSDQKRFPDKASIETQGLPATEFTLAELLKKQGYATSIIGKWHLGTAEHTWPNRRGFDEQFGFYEAYSLFHPDTAAPHILNQRHDDFSDKWIWGNARKGNYAIRRNHVPVEDTTYLTEKIADEALTFMKAQGENPFFLYLPFSAPHTPFQATREHFNRFPDVKDRNKRIYLAMISSLDEAVGRILDGLRDNGLAENTLVIFLSDNGGATYTHATDNAPLKGGKFTNFEGGLNVPFMMRWPGKIAAGSQETRPVIAMDIFNTVAEACGVELPGDRAYDGVDLLPGLQGDTARFHQRLCWRSLYAWAIREGNWKLVVDEKGGNRALYDLGADKVEQRNLYGERPEVVERLEASWRKWEAGVERPQWPRIMDFRFETEEGPYWFPL